jgi:hypothetical protein
MPPATENPDERGGASAAARAAREEARRAAFALARDAGGQVITRPAVPGAVPAVRDVDPLSGMRAARQLELSSRAVARGYIRDAREAGNSWHDIGTALGVVPGGEPDQAGETIAEAAYTYAAGRPDTHTPWQPRSFPWTCRSCEQVISDRGLCNGPADDEHGHAEGCPRLAAAVAAWDAEWEAEQ